MLLVPSLSFSSRILFIAPSRLGDAVLSSGVLARLVATHAGARVTVASGAMAAKLFADLPGLERLHVMERRPLAGHWWNLWRAAIGTRWAVIADLRGSVLAWTLPAGRRLVCRSQKRHEHRVAEIGRTLGFDPAPSPHLWVSPGRRARLDARLGRGAPILAVGPAANWAAKQWPAERFAETVRRLSGPDGILPGARIAVLGAPWERAAAAPVLSAVPPERVIDLMNLPDPLDVFAALQGCAFYLGNDSGLMHMAAAAGIPTLGLFGPSPEWRYGPFGSATAVVRTRESFAELVSENPAFDHRRTDCLMMSLSVEAVEAAARALWRRCQGPVTGYPA